MTILIAEKVLDTTGLLCPLPIVKTSKAIREIEVGQILQVIATDPGALPDMEAWSRQTGHELLESSEVDGKYSFYLRRSK